MNIHEEMQRLLKENEMLKLAIKQLHNVIGIAHDAAHEVLERENIEHE